MSAPAPRALVFACAEGGTTFRRTAAGGRAAYPGGRESPLHTPRIVLGLLGGVASGKSHVAGIAARRAAGTVVDADALARHALDELAASGRLRRALGPQAVAADGRPDRPAIAKLVFEEPAALAALEALLHPAVLAHIERRLAAHAAGKDPALLVLDVPLLVEKGLHLRCDVLWFVHAPQASRVKRAAARGLSEEEILRRQRHQAPLDDKRSMADLVIDNTSDPTDQIEAGLRALGIPTTTS